MQPSAGGLFENEGLASGYSHRVGRLPGGYVGGVRQPSLQRLVLASDRAASSRANKVAANANFGLREACRRSKQCKLLRFGRSSGQSVKVRRRDECRTPLHIYPQADGV